ncbi:MAG TPA: DUF2905 domain-containing protein [Candidatus Methylomirabilis sp.]|nr:DUF2905 domain-containing protein [Candidatus Methylomirabilis sp.]
MGEFGRLLILSGAILLIAGFLFVGLGRTHLPLGHLPGDIDYRGKNTTFYFSLDDLYSAERGTLCNPLLGKLLPSLALNSTRMLQSISTRHPLAHRSSASHKRA